MPGSTGAEDGDVVVGVSPKAFLQLLRREVRISWYPGLLALVPVRKPARRATPERKVPLFPASLCERNIAHRQQQEHRRTFRPPRIQACSYISSCVTGGGTHVWNQSRVVTSSLYSAAFLGRYRHHLHFVGEEEGYCSQQNHASNTSASSNPHPSTVLLCLRALCLP